MSNPTTTTTTTTTSTSPSMTASTASLANAVVENMNIYNDDNIIYSGFLTKQGGNVHNWKIRWFVLKKGTLTYYLTNINWENSKPRGIIYLTKRTEVKETDYRNRKFCFTVNPNYHIENQQQQQSNTPSSSTSGSTNSPKLPTTNRIYLISAQTIFDQGKWIEKIRSALNDGTKVSKKKANQIEKVRDMVQFSRRKDSLPTVPTLLNRTKALETVNENIKVSLSKRKFYFYHDNLTVPLLSYVDSPEPTPAYYKNYHHRRDNSSNNSSKSTSPTGSPTISPSTSPTKSSPFQFVKSKPPSVSSSSSSSSSNTSTPMSTSPPSSRPASPIKNLLDEQQQQHPSPFYNKPVTYIDIANNSSSTSGSGTSQNNISPSSSPPNPNQLGFHRHQPKIVVHHLVKDSFQISNIGGCSFNFEILSPFDPNYNISFLPSSGVVSKGESLCVVVELVVYNYIEVDIYSTLHIIGGGEFTLYSRIETDPYLPLFLQSCSGIALSQESHNKMTNFIRNNPTMLKPLQELAHTMITEGRHIDPKSLSLPSISPRHGSPSSRVRLSKYMLTFTRNKKNSGGDIVFSTAKIYQLLSDKFLISNSGQADASFQFYIPNASTTKNKYSLSLVPKNGTVACGEWFYIKCTMTVFEETEVSEVIQLVINQKEIHHILISIKCENIHSGNKEIDLEKEIVVKERLGVGATGDIYKGLISIQNLKYHLSQISFDSGGWVARRLPSSDHLDKDTAVEGSDMVVVAVKILHPLTELSNEMIQDFYNEVRVLSMLNHPNVVKYVGGCTKIGAWSIVMEYVPGGNLMEVLANPVLMIPFKLVLKMALDIAKGIHYLHSLGILHLDLKSPNLLVQSLSLGSKVNIKVADFNTCINRSRLTHFFTPSNIEDDGKKGTTLWMAPEVIRGALYSEKCDVYSFGIILWELVTRTLPYSNISFNCQIEEKVLEGMRPPRPENVDLQYCQLMEQCWHQDPEERPLFDSVIHSLGKILAAHEIQEQKAKASVRGLRRNHSGSSIMNFMQNIESPLTPPLITPPNIDPDIIISNITNNTTTTSTTTTNTTTNITDNTNNTNNNNTNKATKSTFMRKDNIFSKQKSKRFSIEGSSIISRNDDAPSSIISTATNGSNLPFKFSPPTSFIKNNNTTTTTTTTGEEKKSYLRYRPSLMGTNLLISKSILMDLNSNNNSNNNNNNDKQPQKSGYQNSFFIPAHKKK